MKTNQPCVGCKTLTRQRWSRAQVPVCLECIQVLADDIRKRISRGDYDDADISRDALMLEFDRKYSEAKALDVRPVRDNQ